MPKLSRFTGRFEASILFCDIRGFTSLFDNKDPLEALEFANSVLGELGAVVEACGGSIDKFTGDGFLAYFGGPHRDSNHADEACWCAVRMRSTLTRLNSLRHTSEQLVVSTGVGIHSGSVAIGLIAAMQKTEYTILGSTVNTAARIEGLTKFFSVDCLISSATAEKLKHPFLLQLMPVKSLRGLEQSVPTYWLLPMNLWKE